MEGQGGQVGNQKGVGQEEGVGVGLEEGVGEGEREGEGVEERKRVEEGEEEGGEPEAEDGDRMVGAEEWEEGAEERRWSRQRLLGPGAALVPGLSRHRHREIPHSIRGGTNID